jgi:hypothetical protein
MADDVPKAVKKTLANLVYTAHEEALDRALKGLVPYIEQWKRGEIDAIALSGKLHEFDAGPSREIYKLFTWNSTYDLQMQVAYAISTGLLDEREVPKEVMPHIRGWLAFCRDAS